MQVHNELSDSDSSDEGEDFDFFGEEEILGDEEILGEEEENFIEELD